MLKYQLIPPAQKYARATYRRAAFKPYTLPESSSRTNIILVHPKRQHVNVFRTRPIPPPPNDRDTNLPSSRRRLHHSIPFCVTLTNDQRLGICLHMCRFVFMFVYYYYMCLYVFRLAIVSVRVGAVNNGGKSGSKSNRTHPHRIIIHAAYNRVEWSEWSGKDGFGVCFHVCPFSIHKKIQ